MEDGLVGLPRIGQLVDRFRVVSLLGRGGMAAVFAVSRSGAGGFEKLLAMKTMLPHLSGDPHFLSMFLDEARLASRVQHRNVVQVFDVGQIGEVPFLLMELLAGRNLEGLARRDGVPYPIALGIVAQAAEGLHAAHEATDDDGVTLGIVHRDVSPQNIFVCATGEVKVLDFGIAAARGRLSATRTGEIKGKLRYLAPEQITRARDATRAVDVWALGVVAWELLARRRLFDDGGNEASTLWSVVEAPIDSIAVHAPALPPAAIALIDRCLDRNPSKRPATAHEIATVLGAIARERGGDAPAIAAHVDHECGVALAEERASLLAASRAAATPAGMSSSSLPAPSSADTVVTTSATASSITLEAPSSFASAERALAGGALAPALDRAEDRANREPPAPSRSRVKALVAFAFVAFVVAGVAVEGLRTRTPIAPVLAAVGAASAATSTLPIAESSSLSSGPSTASPEQASSAAVASAKVGGPISDSPRRMPRRGTRTGPATSAGASSGAGASANPLLKNPF